MRVVLVSGIFPPDIGGPATHSDDLRAELQDRGHDVTVITLWDGPCVSARGGVIRIPRRWTWPTRHVSVASWLFRHRADYDAVYATGMHPAAVTGARMAGRPVVVKVVGDPAWERGRRLGLTGAGFDAFQDDPSGHGRLGAMRRLRDRTLRSATAITTPSAYLAGVVEGWLGGPADVTVIPNGVRTVEGSGRAARDDRPLRVVYVGRLVAHKRVERLIDAVARTDGVTLEVVGDGPERRALLARAGDSAAAGRVVFLGDLTHSDVMLRIAAADALALASDYEGLPHVVIEALAAGTPVITPAVGGVAEVVQDGVNGIVLPDAEVGSIAAALARFRDDRALRSDLAAGAAAEGARSNMTHTADGVEALLERARRTRPRIVAVGRARWPERLTPQERRKIALMVPYEEPIFIRSGRPGLRRVGRARAIVLPGDGPVGSVLFYALGPALAAGLTVGRRNAAIMCQSPYEGVVAAALIRILPGSLRPRLVVEIHGDWRTAVDGYGEGVGLRGRLGPSADRAARWALRCADSVRVVSGFTERLAREAGAAGPFDRYPAFADTGSLLATDPLAPPMACRAAFVGALEPVKGIDLLVEAWREVRDRVPDATLVVVGAGSMRGSIARDAQGLGIEMIGSVPHEEVGAILDAARFLVVPSRSEGLGRVVLEAFSRGRAVIGTDVGGIPELVRDGETGMLVPPGDPSALARAVVRAFEDADAFAAMGERARDIAERRDPEREFASGIARLAAWVGER